MTMQASAHRTHVLWLAFLVHRLSGLALAIFLPFHFLALGLAIEGNARLDGFLRWTDQSAVKFSEAVLVVLLAIHMLGGLRLLVLENFTWFSGQNRWALAAAVVAIIAGVAFLARVF
jgi:fumarate reductase subunit D